MRSRLNTITSFQYSQLIAHDVLVTLLSILGANSIALPLSHAFPGHELQYILDQSQAMMLLYSTKFDGKAQEVIKSEPHASRRYVGLGKKMAGRPSSNVTLKEPRCDNAGMMLYTSGTTNRPVSDLSELENKLLILLCRKAYFYPNQL